MWVKDDSGSVLDTAGRIVYFSQDRFVRDICLGDCCFICGATPGSASFNNEHVIPKWLLRQHNLFSRSLTLPNGTSIRYDRYTIPCCQACNTAMGRAIEKPMQSIMAGGYDAVETYRRKHSILIFYVWIGLIFLKTHLKDRKLRAHLDERNGLQPIADDLQYDWGGLHYLHTLVRCFVTGAQIHGSALGSFVAIRVQLDDGEEEFDFGDLYQAQSVMLRIGDAAILATFNDGGGAARYLKQRLERITGPISSLQARELAAELAFLNVHLKSHPELQSSFNLRREQHRIEGTLTSPELAPLDYTVRGKFMHYLFRDSLSKIKSLVLNEAQIESEMIAGRLTFLFDEHGEFIRSSRAAPPGDPDSKTCT